MNKTPYIQARETFDNFPEEIFELWLDDRIKAKGWPPSGLEWRSFLYDKSIEYWQDVTWKKAKITFSFKDFSDISQKTITDLIDTNVYGINNKFTYYIKDSKPRFTSCFNFIQKNKKLPNTVLLLKEQNFYHIVDGNHRLSALFLFHDNDKLKSFAPDKFDAWIGEIIKY